MKKQNKDSENLQNLQGLILELDEKILHNPDDANLYYQRGWLFFYLKEDERARIDYMKAVSLGLDCTSLPYYSFTQGYSYSLRDKIILSIAAIVFLLIIALELFSFIQNFKF